VDGFCACRCDLPPGLPWSRRTDPRAKRGRVRFNQTETARDRQPGVAQEARRFQTGRGGRSTAIQIVNGLTGNGARRFLSRFQGDERAEKDLQIGVMVGSKINRPRLLCVSIATRSIPILSRTPPLLDPIPTVLSFFAAKGPSRVNRARRWPKTNKGGSG